MYGIRCSVLLVSVSKVYVVTMLLVSMFEVYVVTMLLVSVQYYWLGHSLFQQCAGRFSISA